MNKMRLGQAQEILEWAGGCNPGPWTAHSQAVSEAAGRIAAKAGLNEEQARVYGLLHDIGRYKGVTSMMHIYDGYRYFVERGYEDVAQICITHSFPVKDISYYSGANDCSETVYEEIKDLLERYEYTPYDALIQLCDSIALPEEVCLLEKRLLDVAMRHGINDTTVSKWEKIFEIKDSFEKEIGDSIYTLFPEAVGNTFR